MGENENNEAKMRLFTSLINTRVFLMQDIDIPLFS